MLGYLTNQYLKEEHGFVNEGEWLFIQKIKELLHKNSGVSYSYKIHNAYSILLELKEVIEAVSYTHLMCIRDRNRNGRFSAMTRETLS